MQFKWDENKNKSNLEKHSVSFHHAQSAFFDEHRIIAKDDEHSTKKEIRYYCFGKVEEGIITVRFTIRNENIRIIGAGYWRKGKKIYEQANKKENN